MKSFDVAVPALSLAKYYFETLREKILRNKKVAFHGDRKISACDRRVNGFLLISY
jgi:hypothetical protein